MNRIATRPNPIGEFYLCFAGPMIWMAHLVLLYGGHTFICTRMAAVTGTIMWSFAAAIATAIALLGLAGFAALELRHLYRGGRRRSLFLSEVALALAGLSGLGIIWGTLPLFLVPVCN